MAQQNSDYASSKADSAAGITFENITGQPTDNAALAAKLPVYKYRAAQQIVNNAVLANDNILFITLASRNLSF